MQFIGTRIACNRLVLSRVVRQRCEDLGFKITTPPTFPSCHCMGIGRIARSVRPLIEVFDELNRLEVEFISFRENIDTGGALGCPVVVIIGAIAKLKRNLIIERVRAGMRRAKLEGRQIGRRPINVDRPGILRDRNRGLSLTEVARAHGVSRAISKVLHQIAVSHEGCSQPTP